MAKRLEPTHQRLTEPEVAALRMYLEMLPDGIEKRLHAEKHLVRAIRRAFNSGIVLALEQPDRALMLYGEIKLAGAQQEREEHSQVSIESLLSPNSLNAVFDMIFGQKGGESE